MTCRYVASDQPRALAGRHDDECDSPDCAGCLPCPEPHCRVCARAHAEHTCPECLATTRETLHEIARMCDALPDEAEARGVDGEAMVLLGPAADPEARGHLEASVAAGRVPEDYLDHADDERHPLAVLLTWDMAWRDALEHEDAADGSLSTAVDYLDQNMHYMASEPWVPFEDFARDLRACRGHLEAVLRDGEQVETGAPCIRCEVRLQRVYGDDPASDGWWCPRHRGYVGAEEYRRAVAQVHMVHAEWLPASVLAMRAGVSEATLRKRAERNEVARHLEGGRMVYRVADVMGEGKTSGNLGPTG